MDIDTLQKISKVCEMDLETTNSKIYMFGSNNPFKLKGKLNATIKNWFLSFCLVLCDKLNLKQKICSLKILLKNYKLCKL